MTTSLYGTGGLVARRQTANNPALVNKSNKPRVVAPGSSRNVSKANGPSLPNNVDQKLSKLDEAANREVRNQKSLWVRGTPQSSWFDSQSQAGQGNNSTSPTTVAGSLDLEEEGEMTSYEEGSPAHQGDSAESQVFGPQQSKDVPGMAPPADMIGSQVGMHRRLNEQEAERQRLRTATIRAHMSDPRATAPNQRRRETTVDAAQVGTSTATPSVKAVAASQAEQVFTLLSDLQSLQKDSSGRRSTQDFQASADRYEAARDDSDPDFHHSIDTDGTITRPRSARKQKQRIDRSEPGLFVTDLTQDSAPTTRPDSIEEDRVPLESASPELTTFDGSTDDTDQDQPQPQSETPARKRSAEQDGEEHSAKKMRTTNRPKNEDRARPRVRAWKYDKLRSSAARKMRDDLIAEIEGIWGTSIINVVPEAIRPRQLDDKTVEVPTAPRDWSDAVLKAVMALAIQTSTNTGLATKAMVQAVQKQFQEHGGHRWIQCVQDVELACQLLDSANTPDDASQRTSQLAIREPAQSLPVNRASDHPVASPTPQQEDSRKNARAGVDTTAHCSPTTTMGAVDSVLQSNPGAKSNSIEASETTGVPSKPRGRSERALAIQRYTQAVEELQAFDIDISEIDRLYGFK